MCVCVCVLSSKGIRTKMNTITWPQFELAQYDIAVLHVSH